MSVYTAKLYAYIIWYGDFNAINASRSESDSKYTCDVITPNRYENSATLLNVMRSRPDDASARHTEIRDSEKAIVTPWVLAGFILPIPSNHNVNDVVKWRVTPNVSILVSDYFAAPFVIKRNKYGTFMKWNGKYYVGANSKFGPMVPRQRFPSFKSLITNVLRIV